MRPEQYRRLTELYARARDLGEGERKAFIEALDDEPEVLAELRRMLSQTPPSGFMHPPAKGTADLFARWLAGTRVGDFELEREIGRGGMGVVYRARQVSLDRPVAFKVLPTIHLTRRDAVERFKREALAGSRLQHPNIVSVIAFGEAPEAVWYAMSLVEGHDLAVEVTAQRRAKVGEEPGCQLLLPSCGSPEYVTQVAERIEHLADAVHFAHEQGVIHRDIKPQNVIIDASGRFMLADFGLARDERFGTLTETGDVRGTPSYMSPEQARARKATVDHRTDVYSLSVVLYELLTLSRPYSGSTAAEVITKILSSNPVPPRRLNRRIPRELEVICLKGMEKDPNDRYQTARELADDLDRFVRREPIAARAPGPWRRTTGYLGRHRVAAVVAVTLLGAAALGSGVSQARERARSERELMGRLEAVLALEEWGGSVTELASLRKECRSGRERGRVLAGAIERFETRLDAYRQQVVQDATALLEHGLGREGASDELTPRAVRPAVVWSGLSQLQGLAEIFEEDPELQGLASVERTYPSVAIRARAAGSEGPAQAFDWTVERVDPFTERKTLELAASSSPGEDLILPPGTYLFTVGLSGFGAAQLRRDLAEDSGHHLVEARIGSRERLLGSLVPVPAGVLTSDRSRPMGCELPETEVGAFWISGSEISNAQYLEYLDESRAPAPESWKTIVRLADWRALPAEARASGTIEEERWGDAGADRLALLEPYLASADSWGRLLSLGTSEERWLSLPAIGIAYGEAKAYAEWYGCRLPSHAELDRLQALVPDELVAHPGAAGQVRLANVAGALEATPDPRAEYALSLKRLLPALEPSCLQAEGLYHVQGNLTEWCDAAWIERRDGRWVADTTSTLVIGTRWDSAARSHVHGVHAPRSRNQEFRSTLTGFRIAIGDDALEGN